MYDPHRRIFVLLLGSVFFAHRAVRAVAGDVEMYVGRYDFLFLALWRWRVTKSLLNFVYKEI